jgi:hypothetical protein
MYCHSYHLIINFCQPGWASRRGIGPPAALAVPPASETDKMNRFAPLAVAAIVTLIPTLTLAATLSLTPSKDNTLYQPLAGEENSNGAGETLYTGSSNHTPITHRALLAFDLASSLPAGSTITSATLTITVGDAPRNSPQQTLQLQRLTADWGEGTSNTGDPGGQGVPATPNDATWDFRFFPATPWSTPGGDFSPTLSSSALAHGLGTYTFPSTPQLVADLQSFLDSPSSNFGWTLRADESTPGSSLGIESRENPDPSLRPTLSITYTPLPEPATLVLLPTAALLLPRHRRRTCVASHNAR